MVQLEQRAQESPEKAASDSLTENFAAPKAADPEKAGGDLPGGLRKGSSQPLPVVLY